MTQLIGKISFVLLMTILIGCMEESHECKPRLGIYMNEDGSEAIVILDSLNYVHKYKINDKLYSDTSYFDFSYYEEQKIGSLILRDFNISDSATYPTFKQNGNNYTMAYLPHYSYPIWSKSQTVIRSDLDDYYTILYLQTD